MSIKTLVVRCGDREERIAYFAPTSYEALETLIVRVFNLSAEQQPIVCEDARTHIPLALSDALPDQHCVIVRSSSSSSSFSPSSSSSQSPPPPPLTQEEEEEEAPPTRQLRGRKRKQQQQQQQQQQQVTIATSASSPDRTTSVKATTGGGDSLVAMPSSPPSRPLKKVSSEPSPSSSSSSSSTPTMTTSMLEMSETFVTEAKEVGVRWGHTMTMLPDQRTALILGGDGPEARTYKDCWIYKPTHPRSFNLQVIHAGEQRAWHTATYLPHDGAVFVFGGEFSNERDEPQILSTPMLLDTSVMLWYPPVTNGVTPRARSGHTATLVDRTIYFYGGTLGRKWSNELVTLQTDCWQWARPKQHGQAPPPSSYHSTVFIPSARLLCVFGGNDGERAFGDVYTYHVDEHRWDHPIVMGEKPAPRAGHMAVYMGGDQVLIHGGWDPQSEDTKPFDDAFVLDIKSWVFVRVKNQGLLPPLVGHTGVLVNADEDVDGNGGGGGGGGVSELHVFGGGCSGLLTNQLLRIRPTTNNTSHIISNNR